MFLFYILNKYHYEKKLIYAALFVGFLLFTTKIFPQGAEKSKKALDAFITTTTKSTLKSEPVPGAEITVEQAYLAILNSKKLSGGESGPAEKTQFDVILKPKVKTNDQGEFSIEFKRKQFKHFPEHFQLNLIVTPKHAKQFPVSSDVVTIILNKSDGPKYELILLWEKSDMKSNKGTFAVNGKTQSGW